MQKNLMVSVIIPVYNGERYLGEAIESVLAQNYQPLEIIVVDDGSTDGSAAVARNYTPRVTVVSQPNLGAGAARNRGIALAQGEFLAFLDADDLWLPAKLAQQMALFQQQPELDMVFGRVELFNSPDWHGNTPLPLLDSAVNGIHVGAMLTHRRAFEQVGMFATHWQIGEFIDWSARANEQGLHSMMLPEVVMRRRRHADNLTWRARDERTDYAAVLKAALDRRRHQAQSQRPSKVLV